MKEVEAKKLLDDYDEWRTFENSNQSGLIDNLFKDVNPILPKGNSLQSVQY